MKLEQEVEARDGNEKHEQKRETWARMSFRSENIT